MKIRQPVTILAYTLFAITVSIIMYRIFWLKYPIMPTIPGQVWQLNFEAGILPDGGQVVTTVALPSERAGIVITEERIASETLGFNIFQEGGNRVGLWSGTTEKGVASISYRATLLLRPKRFPVSQIPSVSIDIPDMTDRELLFMERIGKRWKGFDPDTRIKAVASFLREREDEFGFDREDLLDWTKLKESHGILNATLILFRTAGLPARSISGLLLQRGVQTSPSVWVEVWNGKEWQSIDPLTGQIYDPSTLLALATGNVPIIKIENGKILETRWSLEREIVSKWRLHFERLKRSQHSIDRWSFFSIPEEFQNLLRILLLVPLGALVICLLRNVIGFPTFGIFMPVLLALAFRNTGLMYGIGIFSSVVLIGYGARLYLDRFRLLLVPRLSVILTLVIICFGLFALIGGKYSLKPLMGVGLLPIVITTMSIERFFILIEESGTKEALKTAAGTLAVAVITFFIVQWEPLQLTFFIYPELLFSVAGVQILLGRYTGYRLSEVIRFRVFKG